jgi:hypothetical protein
MKLLKPRESTEVLYVRVKSKHKKFVEKLAKRSKVSVARTINHIIDCYRESENASNKRKSS